MIAQANLETKRKALAERASKLAFEKIACFERIDAIGRELEQIALLGKVMDVTLEDIEKDADDVAALEDKLAVAKALLEGCSAEVVELNRKLYPLGGMAETSKEDGNE